MSLVSASDISGIHQAKKDIRKETYKKILEQFSKKIKHHAHLNQTSATLIVPVIVLGFPTFDRTVAATYLERQLRNGGYITRRLDSVTTFVQWGTAQQRQTAKNKQAEETTQSAFGELGGLVNLRKVANKYRK
jgi:hypothetical protein